MHKFSIFLADKFVFSRNQFFMDPALGFRELFDLNRKQQKKFGSFYGQQQQQLQQRVKALLFYRQVQFGPNSMLMFRLSVPDFGPSLSF